MGEKPVGGTENMGRNESMAELLMSIWEGITENRDLPNRQPGFFFRQQRVLLFFRELFCFDSTTHFGETNVDSTKGNI